MACARLPEPAACGDLVLTDPCCDRCNPTVPCDICVGDKRYFKLAVKVAVREGDDLNVVCGCPVDSSQGTGGVSDEDWVIVPDQGWYTTDSPVTLSVEKDTQAEYCSGTPHGPREFGPGSMGPYDGPDYVTIEVPDTTPVPPP